MPKLVPQRTCIGCRVKKPKEKLVRITLDLKGNIVLNPKKKIQGRGAYFCKSKGKSQLSNVNTKCLKQAIKKTAFKYAFKKKEIKEVKIPTAANCNHNGPC